MQRLQASWRLYEIRQPPTSSYNLQLPHGHQGRHGHSGHGDHFGHGGRGGHVGHDGHVEHGGNGGQDTRRHKTSRHDKTDI